MTTQTLKRKASTARKTAARQGTAQKVRAARATTGSAFDGVMAWLPFSEEQLHRILLATILGGAAVLAWVVAIALPLALAWFLRGREALYLLIALAWALVVIQVNPGRDAGELALYALYALGAVGVVMCGLKQQQRLVINIGVLGFALAIAGFYFSSIFDKLGRSLGLIGMGALFIGGGWFLERTRRRLLGRIERSPT